MNPKRQVLVALVALVLVALAVSVLLARQDPKNNVRLVFLRFERTNVVNPVPFELTGDMNRPVFWLDAVFRLDAPKNRNVYFVTGGSTAIVSGTNRIFRDPEPGAFPPSNVGYGGNAVKGVKAGASQEFHFVVLSDDAGRLDVWRLEMEFFRESWWWHGDLVSLGTFQSEWITNAMPKSTGSSH